MTTTTGRPYLVLAPEDHAVLGEAQFGMPGLTAIESIGPFTQVQSSGPLLTVHDSTVDAGLGIGHHPHRYNERLFYIEQGELDHDDVRNNIQGHMATGDVGQFTEGQHGMVHSEWNHGTVDAVAYILVYSTDPIPEKTSFGVLADAAAPRYDEGEGARTKELVGARSPLRVNGDIRFFVDTQMDAGAEVALKLAAGEGGLISIREGAVTTDATSHPLGTTLLAPPAPEARIVLVRADEASRVIRVVHGPGEFVRTAPRLQR